MIRITCTVAAVAIVLLLTGCVGKGQYHTMDIGKPGVDPMPAFVVMHAQKGKTVCPEQYTAAVDLITEVAGKIRAQVSSPSEAGGANAIPILVMGPLGVPLMPGRYIDGLGTWRWGMMMLLDGVGQIRTVRERDNPLLRDIVILSSVIRTNNTQETGIAVSDVGCDDLAVVESLAVTPEK